jgi:aerobic-type carbon monoxide dehydrogenase small subunit (CoxS/CutS family)
MIDLLSGTLTIKNSCNKRSGYHIIMLFNLNGRDMEYAGDPDMTLLDYMKSVAGVPVTSVGCSGGANCGACTVLVDDQAVLSCKTPMAKVAGALVSTSNGAGQLIQDLFSLSLRSVGMTDCHYCVPETVMKARAFLEKNPDPTPEQSRRAIDRHLCHCIGSHNIARSIMDTAEQLRERNKDKP